MRRLSIALVMAIALLGTVVPMAQAASYPGNCSTGINALFQKHATKSWPGAPYLRYDGSHAETRVRDLLPCIGGPGSWTGIWAANLDNYAAGGDGFVQLGYAEVTPGYTFDGTNGGRKFLYTPDDDSGGAFAVLSVPVLGNTPIVGHRYEFKIRSILATVGATQVRMWDYCIQDTDGDNVEHCVRKNASWHQATASFHMFEVNNSRDTLGNRDDQATTMLVEMAYRTTNGQWFDFDPSLCLNGPHAVNPDYVCVDSGTNDIHGFTNSN